LAVIRVFPLTWVVMAHVLWILEMISCTEVATLNDTRVVSGIFPILEVAVEEALLYMPFPYICLLV
jgi:hypothetical protein